jgi:hypothetical protein
VQRSTKDEKALDEKEIINHLWNMIMLTFLLNAKVSTAQGFSYYV